MKSIKIGIDMDDVLINFNQALFDYHNKMYGTSFTLQDLTSYHPNELFQCTQERAQEIFDAFYASSNHVAISPLLGAIEGIERLKKYTLILISARPEYTRAGTEELLALHFPKAFSHVHLTGEYQKPKGASQSKGEIARELGIQLFIEDSMSNAVNISSHNIPVVLLDAPWNQGVLPEKVTRVSSWNEALVVAEKILQQN